MRIFNLFIQGCCCNGSCKLVCVQTGQKPQRGDLSIVTPHFRKRPNPSGVTYLTPCPISFKLLNNGPSICPGPSTRTSKPLRRLVFSCIYPKAKGQILHGYATAHASKFEFTRLLLLPGCRALQTQNSWLIPNPYAGGPPGGNTGPAGSSWLCSLGSPAHSGWLRLHESHPITEDL